MVKLKAIIKKNGFFYRKCIETEHCYIYTQSEDASQTSKIYAYEIFIKKIQKERVWNGRLFPQKEKFPHNEAFGRWAWTYPSLEKAFDKLKQIESTEKNNKDEV